jgi:hypothetical protein
MTTVNEIYSSNYKRKATEMSFQTSLQDDHHQREDDSAEELID